LKMTTPDFEIEDVLIPTLEVSFSDLTQENWAWAKVVDAYLHPEEIWSRLYGNKLKVDLELYAAAKPNLAPVVKPNLPKSENSRSESFATGKYSLAKSENSKSESFAKKFNKDVKEDIVANNATIWTHYDQLLLSLRRVFRRRTFNAVALDEYNTFRLLPAFLRPIKNQDPRIATPNELCRAISCIPFKSYNPPVSEVTKHLNFLFQNSKSPMAFDSLPSSSISSIKLKSSPAEVLTENFQYFIIFIICSVQFSSPSSMIARYFLYNDK
jgi:hypothetical protein